MKHKHSTRTNRHTTSHFKMSAMMSSPVNTRWRSVVQRIPDLTISVVETRLLKTEHMALFYFGGGE